MAEIFMDYLWSGVLGSLILLLVLLMRCVLKKAPRGILCALWLLAAIRLLVPFTVESSLSLQPSYDETQPSRIPILSEPPVISPEPLPQWSVPADSANTAEPLAPVQPHLPTEPMDQPIVQPSADYSWIIPTLWISVCAGLMLYTGSSYLHLRYKLREAVRLESGVMESDQISGAFLLGYFSPRIYLPMGLSQRDRTHIIAHEKAHIARWDSWQKLAGYLCCCIHWYNPLVWMGYWLLCRDIEIACDQCVIQDMTLEERKAYSFALLNCGKRLSGFFACPVAFGEVSLKQRIKGVLGYRRPSQILTVIGVMATVFVAVCFLTSPVTGAATAPTEPIPTLPLTTAAATVPETEPAETVPTENPTVPMETDPTEQPTQPTVPANPSIPEPTPPVKVSYPISGSLTNNTVTWCITEDGTLTLSGSGYLNHDGAFPWSSHADHIQKIVMDDSITALRNDAFRDMIHVKEVRLSRSLTRIEAFSFANCTALGSIVIPDGVTLIAEGAFYGCTALQSISLPDSLWYIGKQAFAYTAIREFSGTAGLTTIQAGAFEGCYALETVTLNGIVTSLYSGAFQNCTALKHVTLGINIIDGGNAFLGCNAIETLVCHSEAVLTNFRNRPYLHTVILGGTVRTIDSGAFEGCPSLKTVQITAPVTEIALLAFSGCRGLTNFTIPDTVTAIGSFAFEGTGLTGITIPGSVREMGANVFQNCPIRQIVFEGDAPNFQYNSTFVGVTATIYYPADNPTWTDAKLQNHGGSLTWVAID